jgi:cation-transporting P-type ATPase E
LARLQLLAERSEVSVRDLLRLFAWATVDVGSKSIQALRAGLGPQSARFELLDQLPFKSQNRYSAVRVRLEAGDHVLVLGAAEALQPFLTDPGVYGSASKGELANSGLRLLLFAEALDSSTAFNGSLDGFLLRPLALVALSDELRPEAGAVLEELAGQGIAFKIISGDNAATVRATVGKLDLAIAHEQVVTGDELTAEAAEQLICARGVFGRVAPRQKMGIVETLQKHGSHVAMIGDGVNDVLPIKKADLGIAMGEGSAASKTVAGLVLENNNFELLPATLEEGRTIVRNLRRSAKLFLTKNVYSLMLITGSLFGLTFPYEPQQVTLLNFLTIGVPALLITLSKKRETTPIRRGFLRDAALFVLPTGAIIGIAGLVIVGIGRHWYDEETSRTLLLSSLVLSGIGTLVRVLADERRLLWLAVAVLPIYLTAMYVPLFVGIFALSPLSVVQWGMVIAAALPAFAVCVLIDRIRQ